MIRLLLPFTGNSVRSMDLSMRKKYNHDIDKESRVLENEEVKILWDFTIHTEKKLEYNTSDLAILAKNTV